MVARCANTHCNHRFSSDDVLEAQDSSGWISCPRCDHLARYLPDPAPLTVREARVEAVKRLSHLGGRSFTTSPLSGIDFLVAGGRFHYGAFVSDDDLEAREAYCYANGLRPAQIVVETTTAGHADISFDCHGLGAHESRLAGRVDISDLDISAPIDVRIKPKRAAKDGEDPDYLFVYHMGQLKIEPWHHNSNHTQMFEAMLKEHGTNIPGFANEFKSSEVATGYVRVDGDDILIEQEGFTDPQTDLMSRMSIRSWISQQGTTKDEGADS